jgi:hypothetical protein
MKTRLLLGLSLLLLAPACEPAPPATGDDGEAVQALVAATDPPPADVLVFAFADAQGKLYVRGIDPRHPLSCLTQNNAPPGCPVDRLYFANANVTSDQERTAYAHARDATSSPTTASVLMLGSLRRAIVRDHRTGTTSIQTWFVASKLYLAPDERTHSDQFFGVWGTPPNTWAQAISLGVQLGTPVTLSWAPGLPHPSGTLSDLIVSGVWDTSRFPVPLFADDLFVHVTR